MSSVRVKREKGESEKDSFAFSSFVSRKDFFCADESGLFSLYLSALKVNNKSKSVKELLKSENISVSARQARRITMWAKKFSKHSNVCFLFFEFLL